MNQSGSINSPALNVTPAIQGNSKKVTFSPVVGVRSFATNEDEESIWHNTFEIIEVDLDSGDSDMEIEGNSPPNELENDDNPIEEVYVPETPTHLEAKSSDDDESSDQQLDCTHPEAKSSDDDESSDQQQELRVADNPRKRKAANDVTQLYVIEAILGRRIRNGEAEYLIKWEGYYSQSWEPESNLDKSLVEELNKLPNST